MSSILKNLLACGATIALSMAIGGGVVGCIGGPADPSAVQPATVLDPATTQPSYWLAQPAQSVSANNFDKLWSDCERVARDFLFTIDRVDYRAGVLTTVPLTSRQWFEFWRPDVRTMADLRTTAITNTRRTIYFRITRNDDGTCTVTPKVLVERHAVAEQRITSVVNYAGVFRKPLRRRDQAQGTHESDLGEEIPDRYWYVIGRDPALEAALADAIRKKLS